MKANVKIPRLLIRRTEQDCYYNPKQKLSSKVPLRLRYQRQFCRLDSLRTRAEQTISYGGGLASQCGATRHTFGYVSPSHLRKKQDQMILWLAEITLAQDSSSTRSTGSFEPRRSMSEALVARHPPRKLDYQAIVRCHDLLVDSLVEVLVDNQSKPASRVLHPPLRCVP